MTSAVLAAFVAFALVSSITPGPNNVMLSGANFGFKRSLPHLAGVALGFGLMVMLVGWGLGAIISAVPWLYDLTGWLGAAYLIYLAYKIATAAGVGAASASGQPMTFLQAVAFQWINPKAWTMAVSAMTMFVAPSDSSAATVALLALIFTSVNVPCISAWAAFGVGIKGLLHRPAVLRVFNVLMAVCLITSLWPFIRSEIPHLRTAGARMIISQNGANAMPLGLFYYHVAQ